MKHDRNMRCVVHVLKKKKFTEKQIIEITGKSKGFIYKWANAHNDFSRKCSNRKRKITTEILNRMKEIASKTWTDQGGSLRSIKKTIFNEFKVNVSHICVRYHLKKHFKYLKTRPIKCFLTEKHKAARLAFCKEQLEKISSGAMSVQKIMFSDEKIFRLNHIPNRQTHRLRTNDPKLDGVFETKGYDVSVHVGGAMTYNGLSELHEVKIEKIPKKRGRKPKNYVPVVEKKTAKGITAEYYQREMLPVYFKTYKEKECEFFQQDHASSHKKSRNHIKDKFGHCFYNWPANSPDLNPIENLWSILQQKVDFYQPESKGALLHFIVKEWNKIDVEICQKLVESFTTRLKLCIEKGGNATKY